MTPDEAERLARKLLASIGNGNEMDVHTVATILGDYNREIERQAYERAAKLIEDETYAMFTWTYETDAVRVKRELALRIRALATTPAKEPQS